MLTNSNHQVDKLAVRAHIMKNGQMRKLRDMAEKLRDFDARIRKLDGRVDEHRSNVTALSETTSTEVIEM